MKLFLSKPDRNIHPKSISRIIEMMEEVAHKKLL
jgi:hypothetical protein